MGKIEDGKARTFHWVTAQCKGEKVINDLCFAVTNKLFYFPEFKNE